MKLMWVVIFCVGVGGTFSGVSGLITCHRVSIIEARLDKLEQTTATQTHQYAVEMLSPKVTPSAKIDAQSTKEFLGLDELAWGMIAQLEVTTGTILWHPQQGQPRRLQGTDDLEIPYHDFHAEIQWALCPRAILETIPVELQRVSISAGDDERVERPGSDQSLCVLVSDHVTAGEHHRVVRAMKWRDPE